MGEPCGIVVRGVISPYQWLLSLSYLPSFRLSRQTMGDHCPARLGFLFTSLSHVVWLLTLKLQYAKGRLQGENVGPESQIAHV